MIKNYSIQDHLFTSGWKGCITEVGIGMEFTSLILRHEGASKFLSYAVCPYGKGLLGTRSVSKETAGRTSDEMYFKAIANNGNTKEFGMCITGAHYTDRNSHVWICINKHANQHFLHAEVNQTDRYQASFIVADLAHKFCRSVLLNDGNIFDHHKLGNGISQIDVVDSSTVSEIEMIANLSEFSALIYHDGKFHRVIDYLRQFDYILSGSFNPPTISHHEMASKASPKVLYELSLVNADKGQISLLDAYHRLMMLNAMDVPVLITKQPTFLLKDQVLQSYVKKSYTYIVGSDTWDRIMDPDCKYGYRPETIETMDSRFMVYGNPKIPLLKEHLPGPVLGSVVRSTNVRLGNLAGCKSKVQDYIRSRNLYGML